MRAVGGYVSQSYVIDLSAVYMQLVVLLLSSTHASAVVQEQQPDSSAALRQLHHASVGYPRAVGERHGLQVRTPRPTGASYQQGH